MCWFGYIFFEKKAPGFAWKWTRGQLMQLMQHQGTTGALLIEPQCIFIWPPEALWVDPGKIKKKIKYHFFKAINLKTDLQLYDQKLSFNLWIPLKVISCTSILPVGCILQAEEMSWETLDNPNIQPECNIQLYSALQKKDNINMSGHRSFSLSIKSHRTLKWIYLFKDGPCF